MRPRVILATGLLLQEMKGGLTEEFFESQTFHKLYNWASVCEMIHNSSLIHVMIVYMKGGLTDRMTSSMRQQFGGISLACIIVSGSSRLRLRRCLSLVIGLSN